MCLNGPRTQGGNLPFDGSNRQNMGHLVYIYYHLFYVVFKFETCAKGGSHLVEPFPCSSDGGKPRQRILRLSPSPGLKKPLLNIGCP